jgi:hypothetical protein
MVELVMVVIISIICQYVVDQIKNYLSFTRVNILKILLI